MLETRLGLARSTVRFGSESLFGLTQSSFLSSRHGPRLDLACSPARFARSPAQLKARRIAARLGSARLAIRYSAHLGSWLGHGLGLGWGIGDQLAARLGNRGSIWLSLLGLAQLGARLGVQLEAQLGIGWRIGIRFGLAQGSARLTCLGLVLGIGSDWKPGPARGSTNIHLHPQCHFQSFTHAVNLFYLVRTFFTSPRRFFKARSI